MVKTNRLTVKCWTLKKLNNLAGKQKAGRSIMTAYKANG